MAESEEGGEAGSLEVVVEYMRVECSVEILICCKYCLFWELSFVGESKMEKRWMPEDEELHIDCF